MTTWQPNEALRYTAEGFHDREFWADTNRTHLREFAACPDDTCVAARNDLANTARQGMIELVVSQRPVCNFEDPKRCRKTAVIAIDGVFLCEDHRSASEFARRFVAFARPIRWERDR